MLSKRLLNLTSGSNRFFFSSSLVLKKQSKVNNKSNSNNKNNDKTNNNTDTEGTIDPFIYLKDANERFKATVEAHGKKLNEMKQGKANPSIFNNLVLADGSKFLDVASTTLKGKNSLIVTVFDPNNTKNVISTIMAAGLNLNPEKDANNDQLLKVLLPPPTTESRLQLCKEMKQVFENYKNSQSKQSLGFIRGEVLKQLKGFDKKNDSVRKVLQDLDKTHKEFTTKLQEQLKQAEKSLLS
ncbi:hypothetical protein TPHA_0D01810 [Tetrapisispora phaffii CBS 4417]|uniref:Ribosome-recycling factor, mitochondrial n=1 Tax=Tetrapisispora phaffii (strain ATCC 24235 / CBS 4417 / NBRC 1672 / NRRL Y-8282 / UCD 70-5) TaxID=1071381 RepID=G8BSJ9_TETPH|nr:hypothetical protein TPHA_0D01810 [Tetrapisispora phaffii CBS 4417]CCE62820.1 hypothetical protein TPHA_0D01810 [Tetrapisispora phaffii CBS 4417]